MAWNLLASLIPTGVSMVSQYLNKPKEDDYAPDTSYMDKYIASLRGRSQDQQVYQQTMRPMLRTIGRQGEAMRKQGQYSAARGGYEGTGIEGQMALSRQQQLLGAYTSAGEKAATAQLQESRRLGDKAEQAIAQRGQAVAQGEKAFQKAKEQWTRGLVETGVKGIASVATAGLKQGAAEATAAAKTAKGVTSAYEGAKSAGLLDEFATEAEFLEAAATEGYTDPSKFTDFLKTQAGITAEATKTAEGLTTSLRKGHDKLKVDAGIDMPFEEYRAEFEKGEWSDIESFNTSMTPGGGAEWTPKQQTEINDILSNYDESDIIAAANLQNPNRETPYTSLDDIKTDTNLKPFEMTQWLKSDKTTREAITKGSGFATMFTGDVNNLTKMLETHKGVDESEINELYKTHNIEDALKGLKTTGYITEDDRERLLKYANELSAKLPQDTEVLWGDIGLAGTEEEKGRTLTAGGIYKRLETEIRNMPTAPEAPVRGGGGKMPIKTVIGKKQDDVKVVKEATKKEEEPTTVLSKSVEETHPEGYDETKGWKMKILGDNRVYTKPDGSIILTDLQGDELLRNVLEKSESKEEVTTKEKEEVTTKEKSVDETHPPGYDESKGWSMKVVGDKRVYKRPDGFEFETDLEGNIIPIKETKEKAERGIHDPEKAKTVKALNEKYGAEKIEKMTTKFSDEGYQGQELLDKLTESLKKEEPVKEVKPEKKERQKYTATERIPEKRAELLISQANILTKRYGEDAVEKMTLKMEKEGYEGQQLFNKVRQELGKAEKKERQKWPVAERLSEKGAKLLTSQAKVLSERYGEDAVEKMTIEMDKKDYKGKELFKEVAKALHDRGVPLEKKVEPEKIVKPEKKVESEKKLERKLTSFKTDMTVKALNEKYGKPLIDSMTIKLTEQGFEGEELVRELAKSLFKKKPEEKRSSEEIREVRDALEKGDHKVGTVLDIGGGLLKNHLGDAVKVAEPLGKILENINAKMDSVGIKLDIMDSYRSHDTQKKSYDKWLEGGKKGAFTAHPDTSFHTIGFAFDLAQTNEMKDEKVFKILREAGLIQNPGEWWHWSLENV